MAKKLSKTDRITRHIAQKFRSFGGGQKSSWNPVVNALTDEPFQFATGVDIKDVVKAVLRKSASLK